MEEKRKKLFAAAGVILIAYVILSAPLIRSSGAGDGRDGDDGTVAVYILREEDNRVVAYRNSELVLRTRTPVSSLPKSDRVKLRRGIIVFSEEELKKLVEDYCS